MRATASPTPRPAFSPQPRRNGAIAFVSDRSGNADLYLVEPTGGPATRLTKGARWDLQPAWSPDGTQLAFVRGKDAEGADGRIVILELATRRERSIEPDVGDISQPWLGDAEPAWSPDGTQLAISRSFRAPRGGATASEIFLLDIAAGRQQRLTTSGLVERGDLNYQPGWAPDGSAIMYVHKRPKASGNSLYSELQIQTLDRGPFLRLYARNAYFSGAGLAPDGTRAALTARSDTALVNEVIVATRQGTNGSIPGTVELDDLGPPSWSPDATRVVFGANVSSRTQLYTAAPDGMPAKPTFSAEGLGALVAGPLWAPDGTRLLFASRVDGQAELFVLDVGGTELTRLTRDPADDHSPVWQALAP